MRLAPTAAIRFGWRDYTHAHIDHVAIERLPETTPELESMLEQYQKISKESQPRLGWWKSFLNRYLSRIDEGTLLKDLVNANPKKHFLDLEHRGNHREPLSEEARSLEDVQREFSPQMLEYYREKWREKPLTPDTVSKEAPNLMTAIHEAYTELVAHLKKVVDGWQYFDGSKVDKEVQRSLQERIRVYTEDLAHFLADAFVPMHATEYYDWPLGGPSDKKMHSFIEGVVLTENDPVYERIAQDAKRRRKDLPRVTRDTIEQEVLNVVQKSFKRMFKIVAIQNDVLGDPAFTQSAQAYEQELGNRIKHEVLMPQIKDAQEMLAGVLLSAWEEAYQEVVREAQQKQAGAKP